MTSIYWERREFQIKNRQSTTKKTCINYCHEYLLDGRTMVVMGGGSTPGFITRSFMESAVNSLIHRHACVSSCRFSFLCLYASYCKLICPRRQSCGLQNVMKQGAVLMHYCTSFTTICFALFCLCVFPIVHTRQSGMHAHM